jgi:beta-glucosidase
VDFLGLNYYTRNIARAGSPREGAPLGKVATTAMGWEVYPQGMYETLMQVHSAYAFPALYVTENGAAYDDHLLPGGEIRDLPRIAYLRGHLRKVREVIQAGVPVRGYFVWSLLDNFEWTFGTTRRFGITYIDYPTGRRVLKASAHWYKAVISRNGLEASASNDQEPAIGGLKP